MKRYIWEVKSVFNLAAPRLRADVARELMSRGRSPLSPRVLPRAQRRSRGGSPHGPSPGPSIQLGGEGKGSGLPGVLGPSLGFWCGNKNGNGTCWLQGDLLLLPQAGSKASPQHPRGFAPSRPGEAVWLQNAVAPAPPAARSARGRRNTAHGEHRKVTCTRSLLSIILERCRCIALPAWPPQEPSWLGAACTWPFLGPWGLRCPCSRQLRPCRGDCLRYGHRSPRPRFYAVLVGFRAKP